MSAWMQYNCKTLRSFKVGNEIAIEFECTCPNGEKRISQMISPWTDETLNAHIEHIMKTCPAPAPAPAKPPVPAPAVNCPRGETYHLTNIYEKCISGYKQAKDLFGVPLPICICEKKPVTPPAPAPVTPPAPAPVTPPAPAPAPAPAPVNCPRGETYHLTNIYEKCISGYKQAKDLFGVPLPICICEKKPVTLPTIPPIFNYEKISALIPVAIVIFIIILVVSMLRR